MAKNKNIFNIDYYIMDVLEFFKMTYIIYYISKI